MPKLLFKWLASPSPDYRYVFLDNRVPKGSFPRTVARGDRDGMVIYDPVTLVDIERYQKINIHADSPAEVYPAAAEMAVAANCGFLLECVRRIPRIELVEPESGLAYLRIRRDGVEILDAAVLARAFGNAELAAALAAMAPGIVPPAW
jgi:hypothetical protein